MARVMGVILVCGVIAAAIGLAVHEASVASGWRTKAEALQKAHDESTDKAPAESVVVRRVKSVDDDEREELLQLRGEVGDLKRQLAEANARAQAPSGATI